MEKGKFYITTAIAYPNARPHLGHALEIIQADAAARFYRLLGRDVHFQTGTDEHGLKNWQTAQKEGKGIVEFLDSNVNAFKDLYKMLNVSYDYFIRTTNKKVHYPGAVKLWNALVNSGDIYKKKYKGLYCTGCEAFKTEKELIDGKCPNHPTREIETVQEENYFFKLSKYKSQIEKEISSDAYQIIPKARKNEILSFLKAVKDISFSRPKSSLPWGIEVPGDKDQVMYVWCDALSNYITGIGYGTDEKRFSQLWPADIHIIGKDILRFHAAFWPAMLISAKLKLPKKLFVHGFILSKGAKMGKSTGNIIEPFEQIENYGSDQFRFYLLGAMQLDGDGEYSEELVIERINSELVSNLSNFCYRVLSFTKNNFNSEIKESDNGEIVRQIENKFKNIKDAYEEFDFKRAIDEILSLSALGNKYFQEKEPWKLIKEDKEKAHKILGACINIAKNLSIVAQPIMPNFSSELQKQLNIKNQSWEDLKHILKNHKIGLPEIIFQKVELKAEKKFPLDLKVAKILEVIDHPDAEKLFILKIDLGTEIRQIVAGLRDYYSPEELTGKHIIIVVNMKPAKLRGIESKGMLLAAEDSEDHVKVLEAPNNNPGDNVRFGNLKNDSKLVTFEEFSKIKIFVKDKKVFTGNLPLNTDKEEIIMNIKDGSKIG